MSKMYVELIDTLCRTFLSNVNYVDLCCQKIGRNMLSNRRRGFVETNYVEILRRNIVSNRRRDFVERHSVEILCRNMLSNRRRDFVERICQYDDRINVAVGVSSWKTCR